MFIEFPCFRWCSGNLGNKRRQDKLPTPRRDFFPHNLRDTVHSLFVLCKFMVLSQRSYTLMEMTKTKWAYKSALVILSGARAGLWEGRAQAKGQKESFSIYWSEKGKHKGIWEWTMFPEDGSIAFWTEAPFSFHSITLACIKVTWRLLQITDLSDNWASRVCKTSFHLLKVLESETRRWSQAHLSPGSCLRLPHLAPPHASRVTGKSADRLMCSCSDSWLGGDQLSLVTSHLSSCRILWNTCSQMMNYPLAASYSIPTICLYVRLTFPPF